MYKLIASVVVLIYSCNVYSLHAAMDGNELLELCEGTHAKWPKDSAIMICHAKVEAYITGASLEARRNNKRLNLCDRSGDNNYHPSKIIKFINENNVRNNVWHEVIHEFAFCEKP